MSFVFDGIILLVAAVTIILGAKRGFVKSFMGVCTLLTSLIVAYAFTPTVAAYIESLPAIRNISQSIADTIGSLSTNYDGTYNLKGLFDSMPDAFRQIIDRYDADEGALSRLIHPNVDDGQHSVLNLADLIAGPVAGLLSKVLAFLGLLIVSVLVLKLLTWILDLIFQLPVLKTANTILGLLAGIVTAFIWAWVLSALSVSFVRAMSSIDPSMFSESIIQNTIIVRFFSSGQFRDVLNWILKL